MTVNSSHPVIVFRNYCLSGKIAKVFSFFTLLLLFVPSLLWAQPEAIFNKVEFGDSVDTVLEKVIVISEKAELVNVVEPNFPLAKNSEQHILCAGLKIGSGVIEKMVYTFADNKLVYVEARGNAFKLLVDSREGESVDYVGLTVFPEKLIFGNKEKDIVWMLTQESVHPNLFTWENPYLTAGKFAETNYGDEIGIPSFLEMGADIDETRTALNNLSKFLNEEQLDGRDPNAQLQINAFGIEYAGFPRKFEARFGNGKLNIVWILTAKGEEDRIRLKLKARYGNPVFTNETWEVYNNWQVALRKDKPEVLLATKEMGQFYKKEYFKQ